MSASDLDTVSAEIRSTAVQASSPRWALLEIARWIAIYPIVWLHTVRSESLGASTALTRFAVPFFVATCVFLVFQGVWRKPQRTFVQYGYSRFLRIYVPFLAWSAVYLGFKAVKSAFLPDLPNEYPAGLEILWTGGFYHLWFMPFIFLVSLAAFLVAKIVSRAESLQWPVAIGSLAAGLALSLPAVADAITRNHPSWELVVDALPAMFWAMAAGLAYGRDQRQPWEGFHRLRVDVLLFLGSMIWLGAFGRSALIENLAGVSLLLVAIGPVDYPVLRRLGQFPSLAYGIYFSHLLPIKIFEAIGARRGLSPSWQLDLSIFLASAVAATLISLILYQSRWTRWLVA